MEAELRILIIEDSPADYMLVERNLRHHGLHASCKRVDSAEELERELSRKNWDLVLSDYSVPKLNFPRSFSLIKSSCPDLPVILVSGSIGEEKAVELLKMGVDDFILKDRLSRLAPAIRRCLKDAAEHRARKAAETALKESNERFRMIFDHSIDAIMLTQINGSVLAANPAACQVFGMTEQEIRATGRHGLMDLNDGRAHKLLEQRDKTGHCRGEVTMIRGDGSYFTADISSAVFPDQKDDFKASIIIRDATERKNLEAQLHQSQKMEAIGTLAGGIAHDFNNILTAIVGYSTLLQMDAQLDATGKEYVGNLMALVERAAQLTRSLLAFSRNQVMTPVRGNLNEIISTTVKLIGRIIGEQIAIETNLSKTPLIIMADRGQIEQALMNLATNARDAMPSGGQLVLSTGKVTLGEEDLPFDGSCLPGDYAQLSVTDTGTGMNSATMARIFEPFFTTKEPGKGTGLGLSSLYGIIRQHKGQISVDSSPGHGATFTIHLPLATSAGAIENGKAATPVSGGSETILVAEDDPSILSVVSFILRKYGYNVIEALNGEAAIEQFQAHSSEIDLVMLDMIMPRKNGREAYEVITELKPDVKIVFVSGYPSDVIEQGNLLPDGAIFLQKPVSPVQLLATMRQLLAPPGPISS